MDPIAILSGFAVGAIVGMTGVGGGSLMTPLLIFGFGVKPYLAIGTDLLFAAATKFGGAVGLAMVDADEPITPAWLAAGAWQVEVAGARVSARVSLKPLYDPDGARIRS